MKYWPGLIGLARSPIFSSWAGTWVNYCHTSVREWSLLSRLRVSPLADDNAEGWSWWWYGVDWRGGAVWWRGDVLRDAGQDDVLHRPGVVVDGARLGSSPIWSLVNLTYLVAGAGTARVLTGTTGVWRLLCIRFRFRFRFRFRWRLWLGEFVCVDWSGEAGTGSEGEVRQQGGVFGVVRLAGLAGLLLPEDPADLPVVAVPGRGGRAGQNHQASLALQKSTDKIWLSDVGQWTLTLGLTSSSSSSSTSRRNPRFLFFKSIWWLLLTRGQS